jgi:MoaA/NifB/PqqE/SkfB family radical SAM enzyme
MGCPHCLQDSREDGGFMSLETFYKAVLWGYSQGCRFVLISGGEPTENPEMENMLQQFDRFGWSKGMRFAIASNGTWIEDDEKRKMMWRISRLKTYMAIQVYTNKKWYQDYDFIMEHRSELEQIPKCKVDCDSPIWMQDLGRARDNEEAQREVELNPYNCSCLNAALVAQQIKSPYDFFPMLENAGQLCKPAVDIDGNIHMSESRLCPSVGNVRDDSFTIVKNMFKFKPCMRCKNSKHLYDDNEKMAAARKILGL